MFHEAKLILLYQIKKKSFDELTISLYFKQGENTYIMYLWKYMYNIRGILKIRNNSPPLIFYLLVLIEG